MSHTIKLEDLDRLAKALRDGASVESVLGPPDAVMMWFEGTPVTEDDMKAIAARSDELGRDLTADETATVLSLRRRHFTP